MKFVTCFLSLFLLTACGPLKMIQFNDRPTDILVTEAMDSIFAVKQPLKIVLRVPPDAYMVESNNAGVLYNEMERQLVEAGFMVRDRKLFIQVFNRMAVKDYRQIQEFTDTDIILEVLGITPKVVYSTKQVTLAYSKRQQMQAGDIEYQRYGAEVSYRLILVSRNDIGAQFQFNYKPCAGGCALESFELPSKNATQTVLRGEVPLEEMKAFVGQSIRDLLKNLNYKSVVQINSRSPSINKAR